MLPVSPGFLAAWREGGERRFAVDLSTAGGPWVPATPLGYQADAARGDRVQTRYTGLVTLTSEVPPLASGVMIRIRDGFMVNGSIEYVTVATLIATSRKRGYGGVTDLSGFSVDRRIVRAEFRQPYYMPTQLGLQALTRMLSAANVPITIDPRVQDAMVSSATYDYDRSEAAQGVATALGAEYYGTNEGTVRIAPVPTLADAPVLTLAGTVLDLAQNESVEDMYNVVVVTGDRSDADRIPRGEWSDGNPYSLTYVGGTWGEMVKRVPLPVMLTDDQCALAAKTIGMSSRGTASGLEVSTLPAVFIEPGDVIQVPLPDGTMQTHIIDRVPLTSSGSQRLTTRAGEV